MPPLDWDRNPHLPRGVSAVLASLQFDRPLPAALRTLGDADWRQALAFTDRAQLTLLLGHHLAADLPAPIRERIAHNLAGKRTRDRRLAAELADITERFDSLGIPYLLLKGFSHGEDYAADPAVRPQNDIDFFVPREVVHASRDVLLALGYEPLTEFKDFPTDHLPVLVRKTGWTWRGDFFDPDIPPSVDLHFRFWDPNTECFPAPGVEDFWVRRGVRPICGRLIYTLHDIDELGYSALHLVRHLLRGSVQPYHVYEIARFLDHRSADGAFWDEWHSRHAPGLRRIESIAFLLAQRWFGCRAADALREEMQRSGNDVLAWMENYAASPVEALFHPNKRELWLHLALIPSLRGKLSVARRRLVPLRPPGPVDAQFVPRKQLTFAIRVRRLFKYATHVAVRAWYHARALTTVAAEGPSWMLRRGGIDGGFLRFLFAANLYSFGVFVYFLLYNLYLLDLGFREDLIGLTASAMALGTIAGSVPAAALAQRFGLRYALVAAVLSAPLLSMLRVYPGAPAYLAGTAFLAGAAASVWFVSATPAVAQLSNERQRPLAYSLWVGTGIATGILGGLAGSRLPGWLSALGIADNGPASKRVAILIGCAIAACAALPLSRLRLDLPAASVRRNWPSGTFAWRFFTSLAVWQFAVGVFNPFFNAYFARNAGASVEQIGAIFAGSQLVQAAAVFGAPLLFRRLGLPGGVSAAQLTTALMLALLAAGLPGHAGPILYAAYMSFQVMSEPGLFSMLMGGVAPSEQNGASGLNFLVTFSAHALAAACGGWIAATAGYEVLLFTAAASAAISALFFHLLFKAYAPGAEATEPI